MLDEIRKSLSGGVTGGLKETNENVCKVLIASAK